jgi:hypothetical protein
MQRLFNDSMKKNGEGADSYNELTSGTPSQQIHLLRRVPVHLVYFI